MSSNKLLVLFASLYQFLEQVTTSRLVHFSSFLKERKGQNADLARSFGCWKDGVSLRPADVSVPIIKDEDRRFLRKVSELHFWSFFCFFSTVSSLCHPSSMVTPFCQQPACLHIGQLNA